MKISHLNTRSITSSFGEFSELVREGEYDVVGVSETWLNEDIAPQEWDCLPIPGYALFRQDRLENGGGVALYIRDVFKPVQVFPFNNLKSKLEHVWVQINFQGKNIIIGSLYRPPSRKKKAHKNI